MVTYEWTDDNDHRCRRCEISYMKHNIGMVDHWALYFDWGDRSATYEAENCNGYLIPFWNEGLPLEKPQWNGSWRTERVLTRDKSCSPSSVNRMAKSIVKNGTSYKNTTNNCHHWLIELAKKLDLELDAAIESNFWILEPIIDMFKVASNSNSSHSNSSNSNSTNSTSHFNAHVHLK